MANAGHGYDRASRAQRIDFGLLIVRRGRIDREFYTYRGAIGLVELCKDAFAIAILAADVSPGDSKITSIVHRNRRG